MRNIQGLFITVEGENADYCVLAEDGYGNNFKTTGFEYLEECWEYARALAKGLGLNEDDIDADVIEILRLTRIK